MTLNGYQALTNKTANCPVLCLYVEKEKEDDEFVFRIPAYEALGLAGEAGEVVECIKKMCRFNGRDRVKYAEQAKEELGDALWYLAQLARQLGFSLESIAEANIRKLEERYGLKEGK